MGSTGRVSGHRGREPSARPPIFVVGTPRSGTSLTARILGRHPNIFLPEETPFFHDVWARRHALGDLRDPDARARAVERTISLYGRFRHMEDQDRIEELLRDPARRARLDAAASYRDLLVAFMEMQMEAAGANRWGNQLPKDVYYAQEVFEFFPDAKFVLCVRDVRDFLLSYKLKWRATIPETVERLKRIYHPVVTSMLWRSTVKLIRRLRDSLPEESAIFVPYERMVGAPERTVREICELLGEDPVAGMTDLAFSNSSTVSDRRGIDARSVGTWREGLTPEEVWIAQRVAGAELAALGYEAESVHPRPGHLAAHLLGTPFAFARAMHANRHARGPVSSYLRRRLSPLLSRAAPGGSPGYRDRQRDIVRRLTDGSVPATASIVPIRPDHSDDPALCLTLVFFLPEPVTAVIDRTLVDPLKRAGPDHYYYPAGQMHVTIKNVRKIHDPPRFTDEDVQKVDRLFGDLLRRRRPFTISFEEVVMFPTSVSLIGYTDAVFGNLVRSLDAGLEEIGVPDDKRYVSDTVFFANSTLCRFSQSPSAEFIEAVRRLTSAFRRDVEVREAHLVVCDAVCSERRRRIVGSYRLDG